MQLASTTAKRWSNLLAQDAVSKQESDEKSGDFKVKSALVNAAKANVDRLLALKSFARIVAPFDGFVTARKTDIGALVNAGCGSDAQLRTVRCGGSGSASPLCARTAKLFGAYQTWRHSHSDGPGVSRQILQCDPQLHG